MKGKRWGTILGVVCGFCLAGATTQAAAAERVAYCRWLFYSQEDLAYLKEKTCWRPCHVKPHRHEDISGTNRLERGALG